GLVAEGLRERLTEGDRGVLDRVVAVDVQSAGGLDGQVEQSVLAELGEHVVEEADSGRHVHPTGAIEVDLDQHGGLLGAALDATNAAHCVAFEAVVRAERNAAISAEVPTLTRSHSGGPTSRISTPCSSIASQTRRRSANVPNST